MMRLLKIETKAIVRVMDSTRYILNLILFPPFLANIKIGVKNKVLRLPRNGIDIE